MVTSYRIRENFRVGKLLRLVNKITIRGKTFAVHQAVAIMYCTQQVIRGENFCDRLKNREKCESFPTRKFSRIRYTVYIDAYSDSFVHSRLVANFLLCT